MIRPINPNAVMSIILKDMGITIADLVSTRRKAPIPMAKSLIVHTLRKHTTLSLPEIGLLIGRTGHSTVVEAEWRLIDGDYDDAIQAMFPGLTGATDYASTVAEQAVHS